jgi:fluoride exporter
MQYILVGVGGAFGSLARYSLGRFVAGKINGRFPYGTFIINITGAFLLGIVSSITVSSNWYLLLADGFLGAYTTFSTFMYEGFNLFQHKSKLNSIIYIVGSLMLGLIGFFAGTKLA